MVIKSFIRRGESIIIEHGMDASEGLLIQVYGEQFGAYQKLNDEFLKIIIYDESRVQVIMSDEMLVRITVGGKQK